MHNIRNLNRLDGNPQSYLPPGLKTDLGFRKMSDRHEYINDSKTVMGLIVY